MKSKYKFSSIKIKHGMFGVADTQSMGWGKTGDEVSPGTKFLKTMYTSSRNFIFHVSNWQLLDNFIRKY